MINTEINQIQETLKTLLRQSNLRYETVAQKLDTSVASVKRLLNGKDISLSKLSKISKVLGLSLFELIDESKNKKYKKSKFTLLQENFLSKETKYFLIFRLIILGSTKDQICQKLSLEQKDLNKTLKQFEEVELIERYPNDVIKLIVSFPFEWIDNGPLEKAYNRVVINKITTELNKSGINKSEKINNIATKANIKEFLLQDYEIKNIESDLKELIDKYEILTKLRLKSKEKFNVFSFASVVGPFSWWE